MSDAPKDLFDAKPELANWTVTGQGASTSFTLQSFSAAGGLISDIAAAADEAQHHPDIDLRYPGVIHVKLTTNDAGQVTEHDVQLALIISGLAEQYQTVASSDAGDNAGGGQTSVD